MNNLSNKVRLSHGLCWQSDKPPIAQVIKSFLPTLAMLIALLAIYGWVGAMDAESSALVAVTEQRTEANKAYGLVAHCMNGGTFRVGEGAIKCGSSISEGVK